MARIHVLQMLVMKLSMLTVHVIFLGTRRTILKTHECLTPSSKEKDLTLLHSERPKLYGVLAVLSAIGLKTSAVERFKNYYVHVYSYGVDYLFCPVPFCPKFRRSRVPYNSASYPVLLSSPRLRIFPTFLR